MDAGMGNTTRIVFDLVMRKLFIHNSPSEL
jgi:hypothetical protein